MDTAEHAGDQAPLLNAVERHRAWLVEKAVELSRARPDLRLVAIVAEADAPEAPGLRAVELVASVDPSGSVAVVATRESAKGLLGSVTPGLLDWLEDEGKGPLRSLPVIHAAARGMRTTVIEYEAPG